MMNLVSTFSLLAIIKFAAGGVINSSLCDGCAFTDECFDFDENALYGPPGKFLGCYGTFAGGQNVGTLCGDSHSATSIENANIEGFDDTLCDSVNDDKLLFFFNEGIDGSSFTCPSDDENADNDAGLWVCRSTGSPRYCAPGALTCGLANGLCVNDEADSDFPPFSISVTSRNGGGQFTSYPSYGLANSDYGGAICIRDPTYAPSEIPTGYPSNVPSKVPTTNPSEVPTTEPSGVPTFEPSEIPSSVPTSEPSEFPSEYPTMMPSDPTFGPSFVPTSEPTSMPSVPTIVPSKQPSDMPTDTLPPTKIPSSEPSDLPSVSPSDVPTTQPSDEPTTYPSLGPTNQPTDDPTKMPTKQPIEVKEGGGTKEESGLIGSLSDELSILIIAGGACVLCILIAVLAVCIKKRKNEKATQGGKSTEMAGVAFKVHSDGASPNNSHYQESDMDAFHISNVDTKGK